MQQAYCTAHGAILVTLLGPILRRFQTGVGLLATSCYKAQTFLFSLPLTNRNKVFHGISVYTSPLCQIRDHITICSRRHETAKQHVACPKRHYMNEIHDTIQCGTSSTSAVAHLCYSLSVELIQRFISKPPFDNRAVLWAAGCQWRVSSTQISTLASCICIISNTDKITFHTYT